MSKRVLYFALGQALQLGILAVAQGITYAANTLIFCAVLGGLASAILAVGMGIERIEQAERDMEETAPIPEEIKVSNGKIERTEKKTTLMEKALAAVGMEVEE